MNILMPRRLHRGVPAAAGRPRPETQTPAAAPALGPLPGSTARAGTAESAALQSLPPPALCARQTPLGMQQVQCLLYTAIPPSQLSRNSSLRPVSAESRLCPPEMCKGTPAGSRDSVLGGGSLTCNVQHLCAAPMRWVLGAGPSRGEAMKTLSSILSSPLSPAVSNAPAVTCRTSNKYEHATTFPH